MSDVTLTPLTPAGSASAGADAVSTFVLSGPLGADTVLRVSLSEWGGASTDYVGFRYHLGTDPNAGWFDVPADGIIHLTAGSVGFQLSTHLPNTAANETLAFVVEHTADTSGIGGNWWQSSLLSVGAAASGGGGGGAAAAPVTITAVPFVGTDPAGTAATVTYNLSGPLAADTTVQASLREWGGNGSPVADYTNFQYNNGSGWTSVPVDGMITLLHGSTSFQLRATPDATDAGELMKFTVAQTDATSGITNSWWVESAVTVSAASGGGGGGGGAAAAPVTITAVPFVGTDPAGTAATVTYNLSGPLAADTTVQASLREWGGNGSPVADYTNFQYNNGSGWTSVPVDGMITLLHGSTSFQLRATPDATDAGELMKFTVAQTDATSGITNSWWVENAVTVSAALGGGGGGGAAAAPVTITDVTAAHTVVAGTDAVSTFHLSGALSGNNPVVISLAEWGGNGVGNDATGFSYRMGTSGAWISANSGDTITLTSGITDFQVKAKPPVGDAGETLNLTVQQTAASSGLTDSWWVNSQFSVTTPPVSATITAVTPVGQVLAGTTAATTFHLSNALPGDTSVTVSFSETGSHATGFKYHLGTDPASAWITVASGSTITIPAGATDFQLASVLDNQASSETLHFVVTPVVGAIDITNVGPITSDLSVPAAVTLSAVVASGSANAGTDPVATFHLSGALPGATTVHVGVNDTVPGDVSDFQYHLGSNASDPWLSVPLTGLIDLPAGATDFQLRSHLSNSASGETLTFSAGPGATTTGITNVSDVTTALTVPGAVAMAAVAGGAALAGHDAVGTFVLSGPLVADTTVHVTVTDAAGHNSGFKYHLGSDPLSAWIDVPLSGDITLTGGSTSFQLSSHLGNNASSESVAYAVTATASTSGILPFGTLTVNLPVAAAAVVAPAAANGAAAAGSDVVATYDITGGLSQDTTLNVSVSDSVPGDITGFKYHLGNNASDPWLDVPASGVLSLPAGSTHFQLSTHLADAVSAETVTFTASTNASTAGLSVAGAGTSTFTVTEGVLVFAHTPTGQAAAGTDAAALFDLSGPLPHTTSVLVTKDDTGSHSSGFTYRVEGVDAPGVWHTVPATGILTLASGATGFQLGTHLDSGASSETITYTVSPIVGAVSIANSSPVTSALSVPLAPTIVSMDPVNGGYAGHDVVGIYHLNNGPLFAATEVAVTVSDATTATGDPSSNYSGLDYRLGSSGPWIEVTGGKITLAAGTTDFQVRSHFTNQASSETITLTVDATGSTAGLNITHPITSQFTVSAAATLSADAVSGSALAGQDATAHFTFDHGTVVDTHLTVSATDAAGHFSDFVYSVDGGTTWVDASSGDMVVPMGTTDILLKAHMGNNASNETLHFAVTPNASTAGITNSSALTTDVAVPAATTIVADIPTDTVLAGQDATAWFSTFGGTGELTVATHVTVSATDASGHFTGFEYTTDGGAHWHDASGGDLALAAGTTSFGLRAHVTNAASNETLSFAVTPTASTAGITNVGPVTSDFTVPLGVAISPAALSGTVLAGHDAVATFDFSGPLTEDTSVSLGLTDAAGHHTGLFYWDTATSAWVATADGAAITLHHGDTSLLLKAHVTNDASAESLTFSVAPNSSTVGITNTGSVSTHLDVPAAVTASATTTDTTYASLEAHGSFHFSAEVNGDTVMQLSLVESAASDSHTSFEYKLIGPSGATWTSVPGDGLVTLLTGTTDIQLRAAVGATAPNETYTFKLSPTVDTAGVTNATDVTEDVTVLAAVVGTGAADTFDGSGGAVNIVLPDHSSDGSAGQFDTIANLGTDDTIVLPSATNLSSLTQVVTDVTTSESDLLGLWHLSNHAAFLDGGGAGKVTEYVVGADAYLVADSNGNGQVDSVGANQDLFIKIVGGASLTEAELQAILHHG